MKVLIVESEPNLADIWCRHLRRLNMDVSVATTQAEATLQIIKTCPEVMILDLILKNGSALAVSDFASYRSPETQVIFVTNTSFFSDGSIFALCPNACAHVQIDTPPEDLLAMVEHYGRRES